MSRSVLSTSGWFTIFECQEAFQQEALFQHIREHCLTGEGSYAFCLIQMTYCVIRLGAVDVMILIK